MRPSVQMKKLIRIAALGFVLVVAFGAFGFFCYMGWEFGYKDLQCRQFPETGRFAEELKTLLYSLENDASYLEDYEANISKETISITDLRYEGFGGMTANSTRQVNYRYLLSYYEGGYEVYANEYGIEVVSTNGYYDAWYEITLSARQIQNASDFYTISHDDYVDLVMEHAQLNSTVVYGYADEVSIEPENATEVETGFVTYINEEFSANSYIGYYDDFMYVYSPDEDMFYSSLYGWYSIPDTLFFIADDVKFPESELDLLRYRFASREEILRQKLGIDYMEYVRADLNLRYNQRNIAYYVHQEDEGRLYTNVGNLNRLVNCNLYLCIEPTISGEYAIKCFNFENEHLNNEFITGIMQNMNTLRPDDKLYVGIYTTYPYFDIFSEKNQIFTTYYPYTIPALIITVIMTCAALILMVQIVRDCGRASREDDAIYLNFIDKLPIELMVIALALSSFVLLSYIYEEVLYNLDLLYTTYYRGKWMILGMFIICYCFGMTALLSIIRRGKARRLLEGSLFRWIYTFTKKLAYSISTQKNLTARVVELFALYWLIMLLGLTAVFVGVVGYGKIVFLLGIVIIGALNIGVLVLLLRQAKGEQSIRDATSALAEGDFEYQPPVIKRLGTEQEIIDNINNLSNGLHKAVEKSIYDERMKAELITNVSHDIKTPLTSIINYVDLIKRENIENEKVNHYIEVLDKKSQRLKQLTEDLVEVSKITSGNIELERVPIDFGELLRQSMGEFEDKFAERELQLIDNIQEHSYMIFADGRRTFRILENLFQNIYKYAMPKTRVYIDLVNVDERIALSVKNISMAPLNIDAEELMERFVRGDQARTTEGSGLGLSIARDLVKMQDGEFQIHLDGDLFKVMISFPEFISNEVIDMEPVEELAAENNTVLEKKNNE